jgi:hypothetical protein
MRNVIGIFPECIFVNTAGGIDVGGMTEKNSIAANI